VLKQSNTQNNAKKPVLASIHVKTVSYV